ncbi:MAG: SDR family NAD(P)-dependent oxidoreductase [Anaerolineales bacterium]|nr:SDR family NAD(P)-dependent oxidoreductase [Anaerolineales bacterium]
MRLKDKFAVITGAGRGIGRALALGFAREGAHLALLARTEAEIQSAAEQVRALGRRALPLVCDVSSEAQVKAAIQQTVAEFGRIDVLVNNAGIGAARPLHGTPLATWERLLAVNLTGTFLPTKHVWKTMQAQGGGSIINISSLAGTRGMALLTAYSASKWGQIGLTLSAAEEGKPYCIRVNAVAPGKGDTSMRAAIVEDKSKLLRAEDHVGVCVFLASDESRYITGQVIEIDFFGESGHGTQA